MSTAHLYVPKAQHEALRQRIVHVLEQWDIQQMEAWKKARDAYEQEAGTDVEAWADSKAQTLASCREQIARLL